LEAIDLEQSSDMQTQWSHILPVAAAAEILGEATVLRMGVSLIRFKSHSSPPNHGTSQSDSTVLESEMPSLVAALSYRPPPSAADEFAVPAHIMAGWKRWRQFLSLDKALFLSWAVPHTIQPAQAGHMGLFDCLCHALSHPSSHRMALPDVLIFLAICQQYRQYRAAFAARPPGDGGETRGQSALVGASPEELKMVHRMAQMAFGIYESYMKQKGVVSRDTIHRFMTDIYGEDSFALPHNVALLDAIFYKADAPTTASMAAGGSNAAAANATISEATFSTRCLDTVRPETGSHILLDWVAILGSTLRPYPAIPSSVLAYIDTMNTVRPPLCSIYNLAESRLYEIKRRFHSLVQQQNDMMGTSSSSIMQVDMNSSATANPGAEGEPSLNHMMDSTTSPPHNRHVISEAAFAYHMSATNEELGSGGFLPASLAALVFRTGYSYGPPSADRMAPRPTELPVAGGGWTLFHVLQFGCLAVRSDETQKDDVDGPLLRFLFAMFQHGNGDDSSDAPAEENESSVDKLVLTRKQVAHMILRLMEYAEFRRRVDRSPLLEDEEERDLAPASDAAEDRPVRLAMVVALGLMDPPPGSKPSDTMALKRVVDHTLAHVTVPNQMSFADFCAWNTRQEELSEPEDGTAMDTSSRRKRGHRLYPLMLDLRFIAAVKFGIPPTLASMEVTLIAEIERRHKRRYPVSDVSRRGPRGTVWNLVDATWFKAWASHVKAVEGTPEDAMDGRGDPRSDRVRGLSRISNTGLLVENGNLSLRPDIRWKQDYELLPPLAWSALQAWYDGGPPIHRSVVKFIANTGATSSPHSAARSPIPTENEIELYPYFVTVYLCDVTSRGEARPFQQNYQLSRVSPILVLLVQLCKELDVSPDSARLWVMGNNHTAPPTGEIHDDSRQDDWILNTDLNIVEQRKRRGLSHDNRIVLLLELKDKETGLWPRGIDGKEWSFRDGLAPVPIPSDLGDGVVGLYNMG
jgi:DUSP domain